MLITPYNPQNSNRTKIQDKRGGSERFRVLCLYTQYAGMRASLPLLKRLSIPDKYKLLDQYTFNPKIITPDTFCQCEFPPHKSIDHTKPLLNTKAIHWKHALVHSDLKHDEWPSKVELIPGGLVTEIARLRRSVIDPHYPIMASQIELERPQYVKRGKGLFQVLVFPENEYFEVPLEKAEDFVKEVLTPNHPLKSFIPIKNKSRTLLICGHKARDIRCGIIAPVLKKEFEANLKERGLLFDLDSNPDGIKVGIISHIGGHAYAGNVLYFDEDGLGIWYGRVENKHVDSIVEETIIGDGIIKELYRGAY